MSIVTETEDNTTTPFKFDKYPDFNKKFVKQNEYVLSITFNLGYNGYIQQTIYFNYSDKMTVKKAIRHVEEWLNKPITNAHYELLRESDDLYYSELENKDRYETRGDALEDRILIDNITFKKCGGCENIYDIVLHLVA